MILCLAVSVEHPLVIDRQTDRQTHNYAIYRASMASRGKNRGPHRINKLLEGAHAEHQINHVFERNNSNSLISNFIIAAIFVYIII